LKQRFSWLIAFLVLLTLPGLLAGCFAMPLDEAVPPPLFVMPPFPPWETVEVKRGDIDLHIHMRAQFIMPNEDNLFFPVSGLEIAGVYAARGDKVEEGTLLFRLNRPGLEEEIEAAVRNVALLNLQLRQINELHENSLYRAEVTGIPMDDTRYFNAKAELNRRLDMANITEAHLRRQYEDLYIRSQVAGLLTYIMPFVEGDMSSRARVVATVADQSLMVFHVSHLAAADIVPGEIYGMVVTHGMEEYTISVRAADPVALGFPASEGPFPQAYFQPVDDGPLEIPHGAAGRVIQVLGEVRDVLIVPVKALGEREGRSFVFILEDGVRKIRYVEIGLVNATCAEVLSGLAEGELVVV
jgi:multidrug efflux pump subunit AcrA (membrane-fusion protein)